MPQAKGALGRIIIQEEDNGYGVDPVAPDAQVAHFESCGLKMSRGQDQSQTIRGNRNPTRSARGNTDVAGPLAMELQAYIGRLLKAALGTVATSGVGPYTHLFTIGSALPSLMIEQGFADLGHYFKYNGCKVGKLTFNVTPSGFQKISFDFNGAKETVSGASFDAAATDLGKQSFDGFSLATIEEGGVAIGDVVGIDGLTIDNDLDLEGYNVGSQGVRSDIPEGLVKVSGTLKARFKDLILYNKAVNGDESSIKIGYALGDGLGSAGNESIELYLPELTYSPNAPVISGPKGVVVELPFEAYYDDSAEGSAIQITLKNPQSAI